MATRTIIYRPGLAHNSFAGVSARKYLFQLINHLPRPRMILAVSLVVIGLCIPALMVFGSVPITLFTCAIGLACTATGAVLFLISYGEL